MSTESVAQTPITTAQPPQGVWDGGNRPMNASYGKLMMWFLIVSDAFSFAGLLIGYAASRASATAWPRPDVVFSSIPFQDALGITNAPLVFVTFMTFLLILSSVFVVLAVIEGHRMNQKGVLIWLFFGILGGAGFLGCQAWEWGHLIDQGMTLEYNPFHPEGTALITDWKLEGGEYVPVWEGQLGELRFSHWFFLITGFHGFHVFSGVLINCIIWVQTARGVYQRRGHYEMVEKVGLYWHFVDLVWVAVFLAYYLI